MLSIRLRRPALCVRLLYAGFLIATGSWPATGGGKVTPSSPEGQGRNTAVQRLAQWPAANLGQNEKLRAEVLENPEVRLTAKFKNPRILSSGLDPSVFATEEPPSDPGNTTNTKTNKNTSRRPGVVHTASKQLLTRSCNSPMIQSVNGNQQGVVFTPKAPGNLYRIEGCAFGNARGRIRLEMVGTGSDLGASGPSIALRLDNAPGAWSDQAITARLDAHLSGIPDSPVILAIYPVNGTRIELPGCFFVALRGEPQLLKVIPASWVRLHATKVRSRALEQLEYVSPPDQGNEAPKDARGTSAVVVRTDWERFMPGTDTYDFSNLAPGWVVHSVQLQAYSIACPADLTYAESFGHWDLTWEKRGFTVSWGEEICKSYPMPFFYFSLSYSQYAAKVWVIGPAGTQPLLESAQMN